MVPELVNVGDYERLAEERLDPGTFGYFAGGAGDEWTLHENLAAFNRWVLRPRVLVERDPAGSGEAGAQEPPAVVAAAEDRKSVV